MYSFGYYKSISMEENKTIITIRINASLKAELKATAQHYNRSLSNLAALLLEQGLANYVEPNPQINEKSNRERASENEVETRLQTEELTHESREKSPTQKTE